MARLPASKAPKAPTPSLSGRPVRGALVFYKGKLARVARVRGEQVDLVLIDPPGKRVEAPLADIQV